MKVSVQTIQKLVDFELPELDILVQKIGEQLGAVEEVINIGAKYNGAIVVRVVHCWKHENSDHLSVCLVDDGGYATDVERNEDGLVQVVCGAPNVREGINAVWLPPQSTVPSSYDTADPFVLGSRELRGVMSNGMLASAKELALGDSHEGILEIDADINPGASFAEAFGLNDYIIDIENKMFTHRPDCFGQLGVAREIAGILGKKFVSPEWYTPQPEFPQATADLPLEIDNQLPELVPRFTAITIADVKVHESPVWLKAELARYGMKTINTVVDLTNYYMMLTGQPLHAYDYDKVRALTTAETPKLVIRHPSDNETIALLNGKTIEPRSEAIMIATDSKLIGVGGIMGGTETEVDETTKNIILECANFDMYNIRRTSMTHGLFTDAVTRFNKGQSPLQNLTVLAKITNEMTQISSGKIASQVIDITNVIARKNKGSIAVNKGFINERLGLDLSPEAVAELLRNVEFIVGLDDGAGYGAMYVDVPFWRTDIEIPEDIVEEVGRLYGFDKVKLELPVATISPVKKNELFEIKSQIRSTLAKYGANEVLTYSFVHGDLLDKVGQDKTKAFKLTNALSPELQYYRLSLAPSLLDKVRANIKAGYSEFALFEIGKTHCVDDIGEDALPHERNVVSFVSTNTHTENSAAYYHANYYLTLLCNELGVASRLRFEQITESRDKNTPAYYQAGRSAKVFLDNTYIGLVGEYTVRIQKALKLPQASAGFEIDLDTILSVKKKSDEKAKYIAKPKFPKITQDVTLRVSADVTYETVARCVVAGIVTYRPEGAHFGLTTLSIYQKENDTQKNISFRISFASYVKTLREQEVTETIQGIANLAREELGAERV